MQISIKNLSIEPYRIFFFFGSLMAISTGLHWFYFFGPSYQLGLATVFPKPIAQFHSYQMIYCTFSYFSFGFLLTAFPKWIEAEAYKPRAALLWVLGFISCEFFMFFGVKHVAVFYGLIVVQPILYLTICFSFYQRYGTSSIKRSLQIQSVLLSLFLGALGAFLGSLAFLVEDEVLLNQWSIQIGLYGYILLLIVAVSTRIVPFFTSKLAGLAREPMNLFALKFMIIFVLMRLFFGFSDLFFTGTIPFNEILIWLCDGGLFIFLFRQVWQWLSKGRWQFALKAPLLGCIYLALFWLLFYLSISLFRLSFHFVFPAGEIFLALHEKDFLHFYTFGCTGVLILSIMTRVSRGHGGYPLKLGKMGGVAIFFMLAGMAVRVFFPLCPMLATYKYIAGFLWSLSFTFWAIGYIPMLLQEKIQTKPSR